MFIVSLDWCKSGITSLNLNDETRVHVQGPKKQKDCGHL